MFAPENDGYRYPQPVAADRGESGLLVQSLSRVIDNTGSIGMDQIWLTAAMERGLYKRIDNVPPCYGEILECNGVWAVAEDESTCARELRSVLAEWAEFRISRGKSMPEINGYRYAQPVAAERAEWTHSDFPPATSATNASFGLGRPVFRRQARQGGKGRFTDYDSQPA
jgi:hypothetical protein